MSTEAQAATRPDRSLRIPRGCLIWAAIVLGLLLSLFGWSRYQRAQALQQQQEQAEEAFSPVLEKMQQARSDLQDQSYDIDATVRVLHEIDAALATEGSLETWLSQSALQDYRGVAPEVLAAREQILDVLFRLYARQVASEDQEATWGMLRHMGPVLNLLMVSDLQVGGDASLAIPLAGTGGAVEVAQAGIDREGVQQVYQDWKDQQRAHADLLAEMLDLERELIDALAENSTVYHRYLEEWERVCAMRDRAYLAAHEGEWEAALQAARAAMRAAPYDKEAHLLAALALIEGDLASPEDPDEAERLLQEFAEAHPDSSAPALLLRGVLRQRSGDLQGAHLDLEQAAAYYPKQAEQLGEMLDPYKARSRAFLRKSREGNLVLGLYKSSMLGAAWFSPDLQLARIAFDKGEFERGRSKVMDHFARRRAQGQWDLVIRDLQFCEDFLQEDYHLILPERGWLDLEAEEATFSDKLQVAVRNRSSRTLHNASLVLCLHFTDMHPDDYEPFAPATEPQLPAQETTSFEDVDIEFELGGRQKTVEDIASVRAVLVSDEAVVWVDSITFKRDQARQHREQRMRQRTSIRRWAPAAPPSARAHGLADMAVSTLEEGVQLSTSSELGKDDVDIDLPYLFSVLAPVFHLESGDQRLEPSDNNIEGDRIRLGFDDVANFDDDAPTVLKLVADTFLTELVLTWTRAPDGSWTFQGPARSD